MAAFAMTPANIRLDNMQISVGATDIGVTEGGVEISINTTVIEATGDQTGSTPLQTWNAGDRVTVKFAMKESTYANLALVLYGGTKRITGGTAVGVGGKYTAQLAGLTTGVALLLHPIDITAGTLTNDVNVWKAVPLGSFRLKLGPNKETLYEVEFLALLDTSKTAGKQLIDFGLAAAT